MLLLTAIGEESLGPWIPALFDATVLSLVAILTINRLFMHSLIAIRGDGKGEFIQLKIGAIVFILEAIVMLVLNLSPLNLTDWQETLFDVVALSLGSSLVIYTFILRPASHNEFNASEGESRFDPTIATNLLAYVCLMILFLMVLMSTHEQQFQKWSDELKHKEAKELEFAKRAFLNQLNHVASDLLVMSKQSDLHEFVAGEKHAFDELQQDYINISSIKKYYAQLRFLDIHGMELIRIQRINDQIKVIPPDEFQNKRDRYYFRQAIRLSRNEVYISPLDLNEESGQVEQPYNPMIRLATPVVNSQGNKSGVVIINLKGEHLLEILQDITRNTVGQVMLINERGYWLFGGEPEAQWAFMFPERSELSFERKYPDIWEEIKLLESGFINFQQNTFVVESLEYSSDSILSDKQMQLSHQVHQRHWPVWKLLSFIPVNVIKEKMQGIHNLMIFVYLSVLALAGIGTVMLTQAMLKRRKAEIEIRKQALFDPLTGLSNRRLFNEMMELEMSHARREKTVLALMYLDLDHFKPINDELGHAAGDEALLEVAKRLKQCLREIDVIARLGGDEFAVMLPMTDGRNDVEKVAQRIIEKIALPFNLQRHERNLGISIGIALLSNPDEAAQSLTQRADMAMYDAKHSGRNCFRFSVI